MKYEPKNLNKWRLPAHYFGEEWPEYYVFLGQNRDSDCLERCNFAEGLAALGGESDTVLVVRESHFLCGWVEWIAIHEADAKALKKADSIMDQLADYPVLDENRLSEAEQEEALEAWQNCFDDEERISYIREHNSQFEWQSFAELRALVKGDTFTGYASDLIY